MKKQDTITIAEFGNFIIEAEYNYRLETSYHNKHSPASVQDIKVEKVELNIKKMRSLLDPKTKERKHVYNYHSTISLLDIPPWLWRMLNDEDVLQELDRDPGPTERDPDDAREEQRERELNEIRANTNDSSEELI